MNSAQHVMSRMSQLAQINPPNGNYTVPLCTGPAWMAVSIALRSKNIDVHITVRYRKTKWRVLQFFFTPASSDDQRTRPHPHTRSDLIFWHHDRRSAPVGGQRRIDHISGGNVLRCDHQIMISCDLDERGGGAKSRPFQSAICFNQQRNRKREKNATVQLTPRRRTRLKVVETLHTDSRENLSNNTVSIVNIARNHGTWSNFGCHSSALQWLEALTRGEWIGAMSCIVYGNFLRREIVVVQIRKWRKFGGYCRGREKFERFWIILNHSTPLVYWDWWSDKHIGSLIDRYWHS